MHAPGRAGGRRRAALSASLLLVSLALLGACGGGDDTGDGNRATTLTIYSSLPLQGVAAETSESIVEAEKLALEEAEGRVGGYNVKYSSVDDSTASEARSDPGQASANARRAAQDASTIAVLTGFDFAGTAVAVPVLNAAGILAVSPAATYVGLTRSEGGNKGEPEKYYPSGKRNFARVVPADHVQAVAQVGWQRDKRCRRLYVLGDSSLEGRSLATLIETEATAAKMRVVKGETVDPDTDGGTATLARGIATSGADCLFFGGQAGAAAASLWRAVHEAAPRMKLFAPATFAEPGFAADLGRAGDVTYITHPALAPDEYSPEAEEFFGVYRDKYGHDPDPLAIYGYEAMKAVLQAIQNAGDKGNDRDAVIEAFMTLKDRSSVLGQYSIDDNGDTTRSEYGGYRVRDGELVFSSKLDASR